MWRRASLALAFLAAGAANGQAYRANIERGREYLYNALEKELPGGDGNVPILCFGTYALLKTAPENARHETLVDPKLRALVTRVRREAERVEGATWVGTHWGNYGMAAMVMCLCADDPDAHQSVLKTLVAALIKNQHENGSWPYPHGSKPDTSQTQIVLLALWDASLAGIEVPLPVWDKALYFQIVTQSVGGKGGGGFSYNPNIPPGDKNMDQGAGPPGGVTASMGVAGLSTLIVGRDQMPSLKKKKKVAFSIGELVRPVVDDESKKVYVPKCTKEKVDAAITMAENFVGRVSGIRGEFVNPGREIYYCYGLERCSALLRGGPLGNIVTQHSPYVAAQQKADGHWDGPDGKICDTCMAIMYLGRATQRKLAKIDVSMLGRTTAIGGTGIPTSQGGSALARQAERYRTTPVSNIADVVKIFDNPDLAIPEETAAQIATLTPEQMKEVVKAMKGDLRKLRRYAYDLKPDSRRAALTALARSRDFLAAPMLYDALTAKEDEVYDAAREGLRYLSRDPSAFDLPLPDARGDGKSAAGIARVKAWIEGLKIELPAYQVYTPHDEK